MSSDIIIMYSYIHYQVFDKSEVFTSCFEFVSSSLFFPLQQQKNSNKLHSSASYTLECMYVITLETLFDAPPVRSSLQG